MRSPQLWGGIECTVNRVGNTYFNQLRRGGHDQRLSDLDCIAQLGIRQLRYPILWELTAPREFDDFDWHWADERLARLRELGIEPIVGLMHHGGCPRYTHLLDDNFPELFSRYARAVAERYPWLRNFTPINEPLTTARFSALYGHWYPHRRDDHSFVRAIVNQCRATVLAMRAIRGVNSDARLIQTDDVGLTRSTPKLAHQANFDNERRWLGWDLLCGSISSHHPLWNYLRGCGLRDTEVTFFQQAACIPDLFGVNHYVTSDRYLSEARHLFSPSTWGGNGTDTYADVEAVRVLDESDAGGIRGALQDTWNRYHQPLALTEAHLGCTVDEQRRWLWQAWNCANSLSAEGLDIRAVTAWALFGSFNWNSLLTADANYYEPGAFDVRSGVPQPTRLASLTRILATGVPFQPDAELQAPGWWQHPDRVLSTIRAVKAC